MRLNKTFMKALLIISLLLWTWLIADAFAAELCLDEQNAFKLDTVLKECRNDKEQLSLMNEALPKCEKQIEICKEQKKQDREICDKEIAVVKPKFMDKVKTFIFGSAAGMILTGVVIILL